MLKTQKAAKPAPVAPVDAESEPHDPLVIEAAPPVASDVTEAILPPPVTIAETQTPGLELGPDFDFEGPLVHDDVPLPPKTVLRKLETGPTPRVWRWMSDPHVKNHGMRQYETYSPDAEDRSVIQRGDCHPGLSVSVDNRIRWGEDAFLASIPKKAWLFREAQRRKMSQLQTDLSRNRLPLAEAAERAGIKLAKYSIESRTGEYRRGD